MKELEQTSLGGQLELWWEGAFRMGVLVAGHNSLSHSGLGPSCGDAKQGPRGEGAER